METESKRRVKGLEEAVIDVSLAELQESLRMA